MIDEQREPPRQVWHFGLLVGFVFAVLASQLLGARPLMVAPFNNVATAGVLPPKVRVGLEWWQTEDWTAVVHRSDWNRAAAYALGRARPGRPLRLGWVVREWGVLSLPVAGWRQGDVAIVAEDGYGYKLSALTPEQRRTIDAAGAVGWFPWWRFVWGWPVLGLLAAFIWAEGRWQARRRAQLGIM